MGETLIDSLIINNKSKHTNPSPKSQPPKNLNQKEEEKTNFQKLLT
jgi:hypothetical protein